MAWSGEKLGFYDISTRGEIENSLKSKNSVYNFASFSDTGKKFYYSKFKN